MRVPIVVAALLLAPEAHALDPSRPISGYTVESWDVSRSMSGQSVYAVAPTPDGFLWIASGGSVGWFDGVSFDAVEATDGPIFGLLPRGDGGAWYAVGYFRTRPGVGWVSADGAIRDLEVADEDRDFLSPEPRQQRRPDGPRFTAFRGLFEEPDGTLWIGGTSGLLRVKSGRIDRVIDSEVMQIAGGTDGRIYATGVGSVSVLRHGKVVESYGAADGVPTDWIYAVAEYGDGSLFLGCESGVFRLQAGEFRPVAGLDSKASDLLVDRDGNLWAGTDRGPVRWRDGVVSRLEDTRLANAYVWDMAEDRDGAIWIGTQSEGLWRLSGGAFSTIGAQEGLSHDLISSITRDGDAMWVGGLRGIDRVADGVSEPLRTRKPLPPQPIRNVVVDAAGDLWVSFGGITGSPSIARVSDGEVTLLDLSKFQPIDPGSANSTGPLVIDGAGDLWAGAWRGLVQLRDGRPLRRWTEADGLPDEGVRVLIKLSDGRILVSSDPGLAIAISSGIEQVPGAAGRAWAAFAEGDRLWLGYANGLRLRIGDRWHALSEPPVGLPLEDIGSITPDDDGRIWVGTARGVFVVRRTDVLEALAGTRPGPVPVRWFGTADGMRSGDTGAATRDARGRIWFATARGVSIVDPRAIGDASVPPAVRVRRIRADGSTVKQADFAPGTSRFEIDYTAAGLRAPEKIRFKHLLEGFDGDWIEAGPRRTAYYTNVPPGSYRFRVIAADESGIWSPEGASIPVEVLPLFWQTRVFVAALLFGLVASGAGVVRLRGRQLRARAADLERQVEEATGLLAARMDERLARTGQVARFGEFAASVAHNLKTPLTFLRGEIELLDEKRRSGNVPAAELESALRALLEQVRRMNAEIETGMSFVRPGAAPIVDVDLAALAREIALLLRSRATASNVKIDIAIEGELRVRGNLDNLRHAIANLVGNAIDAMPGGGIVTISGRPVDGFAEVRVADTGPGIPESVRAKLFRPFVSTKGEQGTGLGLASCRRIVEEEHGGKIRLEPSASGAEFVLQLPS